MWLLSLFMMFFFFLFFYTTLGSVILNNFLETLYSVFPLTLSNKMLHSSVSVKLTNHFILYNGNHSLVHLFLWIYNHSIFTKLIFTNHIKIFTKRRMPTMFKMNIITCLPIMNSYSAVKTINKITFWTIIETWQC